MRYWAAGLVAIIVPMHAGAQEAASPAVENVAAAPMEAAVPPSVVPPASFQEPEADAIIPGAVPELPTLTETEIAKLEMPELAYESADVTEKDMEKYFYFHRADTDFNTAYRDILECDALASGISFYSGIDAGQMGANMAQYGALAGGIGSAIGSVIADAIFGSSERRKQRRSNIRHCMFYKGYDRYALEKDLWQEFHFEEGNAREEAGRRSAKLKVQALVASGPAPQMEAIAP